MKPAVELHSPKQVARALGVSESSMKRWCDDGLIRTTRTAGGHRKVQSSDAIQFARQQGLTFVAPEILGLPPAGVEVDSQAAATMLAEALLDGNDSLCRQLVLNLAFNKQSLASLFDDVIAQAFVEIGERWACRQADVYQERRACQTILRILGEISTTLAPASGTLSACGGTTTGNAYSIQTSMAEIVLRDCGYSAKSLGAGIPFQSLVRAVRELRPDLFWLSAAYIADETEFLRGLRDLSAASAEVRSTLVIGGRALTPTLREQIPDDVSYCENMQQLTVLARSLVRIHEKSIEKATRQVKNSLTGARSRNSRRSSFQKRKE